MTISNAKADELASLPKRRPVWNAVSALVDSLGELDPAALARAEVAKSLALKVDQAASAKTGSMALAVSSLSRELSRAIDSLVDPSKDQSAAELISAIFQP
jgi:hypothetical protein